MAALRFEWDARKERTNLRKHRVSFEEARSVFLDEEALVAGDPDHSETEDRFIIIGFSIRIRVLLVCFCERHEGDAIRIISARRATRKERAQYREGRLL